jgi:8-oxo-dGTP pyrophosphatase MutT (NUDIX family)
MLLHRNLEKLIKKRGMETTCGIYLYSIQLKKILACHATRARWNLWSIPKGLKEEGEDCYDAAVRELYEECGVDVDQISILEKRHLQPVRYQKQNKQLESFLLITDTSFEHFKFSCNVLIDDTFPEVDKWKWIDLGRDSHLLHETQQRNIERIKIMIEAYLLHSKIMI